MFYYNNVILFSETESKFETKFIQKLILRLLTFRQLMYIYIRMKKTVL